MAMNRSNKLAAGGAALLVVVAGGWLMLSRVADAKAEERVAGLLDQYEVRDGVSWAKVSASPFGSSVRIDGVTVGEGVADEQLTIDRVDISEFVDEGQRKRARIRMTGIAAGMGGSPAIGLEWVRASGRTDLPPADVTAFWDIDFEGDDSVLHLGIDQPGVMKASIDLELERIAALARFVEDAGAMNRGDGRGRPMQGWGGGMAPGDALGNVFAMLEMVGDVRVRRVSAALEDDGLIRRSIALHKRYAIPVRVGDGEPGVQRDKQFRQQLELGLLECERELPVRDTAARKKACATLIGFVSGERKSISLKVSPERPVAFGELFQAAMEAPDRLVLLLRPELGP